MIDQKEDENLSLWKRVYQTPPSATKTVSLDGRSQTTIKGSYFVELATKTFGAFGKGWGYEILDERFDEGAPILDKTTKQFICFEKVHTIYLEVWIEWQGEKLNARQYGHTKFVYGTKYGVSTDSDYAKKTLTDAMKKCLSLFGFAGDIFAGMFDHVDYVEAQQKKEFIEKSIDQQEAYDKVNQEFAEWAKRELGAYDRIPEAGLRVAHRANLKKLDSKLLAVPGADPAKWHKRFEDAFNQAMSKFTKTEEGN